ncbi:hypothetical protein ACIRU2_00515 [Streptomyces sp. NPDC101169]
MTTDALAAACAGPFRDSLAGRPPGPALLAVCAETIPPSER